MCKVILSQNLDQVNFLSHLCQCVIGKGINGQHKEDFTIAFIKKREIIVEFE